MANEAEQPLEYGVATVRVLRRWVWWAFALLIVAILGLLAEFVPLTHSQVLRVCPQCGDLEAIDSWHIAGVCVRSRTREVDLDHQLCQIIAGPAHVHAWHNASANSVRGSIWHGSVVGCGTPDPDAIVAQAAYSAICSNVRNLPPDELRTIYGRIANNSTDARTVEQKLDIEMMRLASEGKMAPPDR
jgi:hypothetical protein